MKNNRKFSNRMNMTLLSILMVLLVSGCSQPVSEEEQAETTSQETTQQTSEKVEAEEERREVSFFGVGDNLIHSEIIEEAYREEEDTHDFKPIYSNLAEDIEEADIAFINQETTFGGDHMPFTGYPSFNTPSAMAGNLVDLGFDMVNGANNHTLDYGTQGVHNNLDAWNEYRDEVLYTGTFTSQEERDKVRIIERNDMTFSLLAYTDTTNGQVAEEPYHVNLLDAAVVTQDVQKAQEASDFVVVSVHWGEEHALEPNERQREYAQLFADLGVDAVIGTHSHTIQPVEWVTGKNGNETLVVYSLGNVVASTLSDINLLGGNINFNFVEEEGEHFIDDVEWKPLVIHYEKEVPGNLESRTDFSVHYLEDYTDEMAAEHGLANYEENTIDPDYFEGIAEEVIDEEFRE